MAARQAKRVTVAKVIGEARRSPRRLQRRLQRDVLREVMLSASECNAWLTLEELARITRYPAASISAQLRHFAETAARRLPAAEALASVDESCHVSRGGGVRAWAAVGIPAGARPACYQVCLRAGLRGRPIRGQLRERAGVNSCPSSRNSCLMCAGTSIAALAKFWKRSAASAR
jgi:hypothetical protein